MEAGVPDLIPRRGDDATGRMDVTRAGPGAGHPESAIPLIVADGKPAGDDVPHEVEGLFQAKGFEHHRSHGVLVRLPRDLLDDAPGHAERRIVVRSECTRRI